jgi:acetyl coenzyme A synthetase (ADP forming)-like protein
MERDKRLDALFYPSSVAVIGASSKRSKIGYEVLKNLKRFKGRVYAVNPKESSILGIATAASIGDIEDSVDLAIIAIPAASIPDVLEQCGAKGVRAAVVLSAGFSEAGAREAEQELSQIASKYDMVLVGPNTVGIANNSVELNASFLVQSKQGGISFLSQSGALGAAVMYKTVYEDIGFAKFVSLGNMAGIGFSDLLAYLSDDTDTASIALYIEGVKSGREFLSAATRCSRKKPIIALKSGRSAAGKRATSSHTGSLAGSDEVYDTAFRQAGVIRANTIDELLDMAKAFEMPKPKGGNVAILTNAGGPGILAADACERYGLAVTPLGANTVSQLKTVLPAYAATGNPVDTIAQSGYDEYLKCMQILQADPSVDAILAVIVVPTFTRIGYTTHAKALLDGWDHKTPLVTCFMSGDVTSTSIELMKLNGIPAYPSPERAACALGALYKYATWYNENSDNSNR